MKEYPILFSGPMVKAILEDRKTQTRRVIKPQPEYLMGGTTEEDKYSFWYWEKHKHQVTSGDMQDFIKQMSLHCPFGKPGDELWARETHAIVPATAYRMSTDDGINQIPHKISPDGTEWAVYREGWTRSEPLWKPSIHIPRWASRISLENSLVRVERIQDICLEDALAEGLIKVRGPLGKTMYEYNDSDGGQFSNPLVAFRILWNKINAHWRYEKSLDMWTCYPWCEEDIPVLPSKISSKAAMGLIKRQAFPNPWVWAVTFKVLEASK